MKHSLRFTANLSLLFTEVNLQQRFKLAKENGFHAVEIQFPYSLSAETIRHELDQHSLKLVLFNVDADDLLQGGEGLAAVPEKQAQFQQAIAQTVSYAKILQPEVINILPGCCFNSARLPEYLATFKDNLRYALKAFSALGIKTVFEAVNTVDMPDFIIHNHAQMLSIVDEINHPDLSMQYDIYHMYKMQQDCAQFITEQAHKIAHIQFADCPDRHEPGTGIINFDQLFNIIAKSEYSGWIGAEYKPYQDTMTSLTWLTALAAA